MYILPKFLQQSPQAEVVAAVDLGSNSFHMIVARFKDGQIHVLDRLKEMVRLGGGLDKYNYLSEESQQRAIDCLARFGQRLQDMPVDSVRVVGTNVFRAAVNAEDFLPQAEQALGHPIEVVSGREEARLIYLGVAHTLASTDEKTLVVDIGGGSTEFIIGQKFDTLERESLSMGCVSMTQRYFANGEIKAKPMRRAEIHAQQELQVIKYQFKELGWDMAIGAAGTLRSVERVIREMGWDNKISRQGLQRLKAVLLEAEHIDNLKLKGLSARRTPVFPGGVAIISGIFDALGLESMKASDSALREGVVLDLFGRIAHEDTRETTIHNLMSRYLVDAQQAKQVENTALAFLEQTSENWHLNQEESAAMLSWAARLHEIGLSIAHDSYHKHGEYLITYSDLAGFSRQEQAFLATLVRSHRRRVPTSICETCSPSEKAKLQRLCILLRLAVLVHRSRTPIEQMPEIVLQTTDSGIKVRFPPQWLEKHPLTHADLEQEREYLKEIQIVLDFE
ncbi:exopolyphosphatase [Candidatus Albibeggiatoa sp. nov. NOAA]|uniref:exopolyphosphatase n=1 Tax=Candidatus Albibeggiatoa sp. nov. NOAA TaxID=3162724 RepID=UPI0032F6FFB0|nr:exopolyphosphatase [Thiotrichaceae bacterium]